MKKGRGQYLADQKNSRMIHTGTTIFSFMNISMVKMERVLEPATKPAGPAESPRPYNSTVSSIQQRFLKMESSLHSSERMGKTRKKSKWLKWPLLFQSRILPYYLCLSGS